MSCKTTKNITLDCFPNDMSFLSLKVKGILYNAEYAVTTLTIYIHIYTISH